MTHSSLLSRWKLLRHIVFLQPTTQIEYYPLPFKQLALILVLLAALSHGLGSGVILLIYRPSLAGLVLGLGLNGLSVLVGYYLWTGTIAQIKQRLPKPSAYALPSFSQLLVPVGMAYAPQVFNFLTVVPLMGRPIEILLATWTLLAVVTFFYRTYTISLLQALLMTVGGWILAQVAIGVLQLLVQQTAAT